MYNQVTLVDVKTARSPIPTMEEYRFWVRENRKASLPSAEGVEITVGQVGEDEEKPKEEVVQDKPIEQETQGGPEEVDDEEVENNFFDRFEEMSDVNLKLNDGIRSFVQNNQRQFIQFFDGIKVGRS